MNTLAWKNFCAFSLDIQCFWVIIQFLYEQTNMGRFDNPNEINPFWHEANTFPFQIS